MDAGLDRKHESIPPLSAAAQMQILVRTSVGELREWKRAMPVEGRIHK
jgi:hypothetical protein